MASDADSLLLRHAPATVHGRYLVQPPRAGVAERWLVGFHGYGQTADTFLDPLARMAKGGAWRVVSVQALHPFYASRTNEVVANWMTRQDRELAIADNIGYVDSVLDRLEAEFGAPRTLVFAGFSQGAAMAYRAGLLGKRACAAIIASGGDVPPEFADKPTRPWPLVLAATGRSDTWYTPAQLERELAAVRTRRPDASALVFDGGHEWSAALIEAGAGVLAQLEAADTQ